MIQYKKISKKTAFGNGTQITLVASKTLNSRDIAEEIERTMGIPRIRTMSLLDALGFTIIQKLKEGCIINIDELGSFRPGLSLNNIEKPEVKKITFTATRYMMHEFNVTQFVEIKDDDNKE